MLVRITKDKQSMTIITDKQFAEFIETYPLYKKYKVVEKFEDREMTYSAHQDFDNKSFNYTCPIEGSNQTFKTKLWGPSGMFYRRQNDQIVEGLLPPFFDKVSDKLNLTVYLNGVCQSCGHNIDILIHASSDKTWQERDSNLSISIQKIGQFPSFEIEPDQILKKYLNPEDFNNYKKALTSLSANYGIGAYSYFRRIIENEIKRIVTDLSELEFEGSENIRQALKTFNIDHQMGKIVDVIYEYLPSSLTLNGDNPIKLLYAQLSIGIHTLTDDDCFEKAKLINILLKFVITKINEEKYQIKEAKDAMKKLSNNGS